jgi:hypothetical protein
MASKISNRLPLDACDRAYWNASQPVRQLAVKDIPIGERVEFDYKGRGYPLTDE